MSKCPKSTIAICSKILGTLAIFFCDILENTFLLLKVNILRTVRSLLMTERMVDIPVNPDLRDLLKQLKGTDTYDEFLRKLVKPLGIIPKKEKTKHVR